MCAKVNQGTFFLNISHYNFNRNQCLILLLFSKEIDGILDLVFWKHLEPVCLHVYIGDLYIGAAHESFEFFSQSCQANMDSFIKVNSILVSSLQDLFYCLRVSSNGDGLPLVKDTRWIKLVQFGSKLINTSKKNTHSERSYSTWLSKLLKQVSHVSCQVAEQNWLLITQLVSCIVFSCILHEHSEVTKKTSKSSSNMRSNWLDFLYRICVNQNAFEILFCDQNHTCVVLDSYWCLAIVDSL